MEPPFHQSRRALTVAIETLGVCHVMEEGPNARWIEWEDGSGGDYNEDLVCRADCPVCAAIATCKAALREGESG